MRKLQNVKDGIDEMYYNYLIMETQFFFKYIQQVITIVYCRGG